MPKTWSLLLGAGRLRAGRRRFSAADDRRLQEITTEFFPRGYTVLDAAGGWLDPATGKFVREQSRQILIASDSAVQIRRWAQALGNAFGQKEILLLETGRATTLKIRSRGGRNKPRRG